jgi:hypothetical protein
MRFILYLILTIWTLSCCAQNRMLDEHTLLIDSYTSIKKDVLYYKMAEAWPGLKDPAVIIIDGEKLSELTSFKMCNGQSGDNYFPWHISTATFKPKDSTQVVITANGDYAFCVHGLKNLIIDGDNKINHGISNWTRTLTGSFGFNATNWRPRGQVYSLSVLNDGSITMHNFEGKHGFCVVKINGYSDTFVRLNISNFYVHDTIDGEGFYIGSTQPPPVTKFSGIIENGIITRTACEGLQLQHCYNLDVRDITITQTGTAWQKPFQQYQDTGIQWVCAGGVNSLENIFLDGSQSIGLNCFGGDGVGAVNTVTNVFIYNSSGQPIAFQNSCNTNATWVFRDGNVDYTTWEYYNNSKVTKRYLQLNTPGNDKVYTENFRYSFFNRPFYVNSGFESSNIKQWRQYYASYLQAGDATMPCVYKRGEIIIDTTEGKYEFYKVKSNHSSDGVSPRYSNNFERVLWSGNNYPPDDLRCINYFTGFKWKGVIR